MSWLENVGTVSDAAQTFRTVSRVVSLRMQQRGAISDKRVPLSVFRPFALVVRYVHCSKDLCG